VTVTHLLRRLTLCTFVQSVSSVMCTCTESSTCDLTMHHPCSSLICSLAAVCHHTSSRPWRSARRRCMSRPLAAIVRRCRRRRSDWSQFLRPVKPHFDSGRCGVCESTKAVYTVQPLFDCGASLTHHVTHLVWPHQPENPPGRPKA